MNTLILGAAHPLPVCPLITDMMERSKNDAVSEAEFGTSCGRDEVPGMCIAIVSGVLLNKVEMLFGMKFVFIPHKPQEHGRSLRCKTNKSEERLCMESPQLLTHQFQLREYFMKMKHPKVTGIIKAYKSLKRALFLLANAHRHNTDFSHIIMLLSPHTNHHLKHTEMQQAPCVHYEALY